MRLVEIHGDRLFHHHMLARRDRVQRDRRVIDIRRRDQHRLHVVSFDDFTMIRAGDRDAGRLLGLFQHRRIGIAQRDDFGIGTERESGQMVGQGDPAASDDGYAEHGWGFSFG